MVAQRATLVYQVTYCEQSMNRLTEFISQWWFSLETQVPEVRSTQMVRHRSSVNSFSIFACPDANDCYVIFNKVNKLTRLSNTSRQFQDILSFIQGLKFRSQNHSAIPFTG